MATFFPRSALTQTHDTHHEDPAARVERLHTFYAKRFAQYPIEHLRLLCWDNGIDFVLMSYSQMVQSLAAIEAKKG